MNRVGFFGGVLGGSGGHLRLIVIARFGFGWRYGADGLEQPAVVEPVDPLKRGELNRLEGLPPTAAVDHLGLVEAVDRLGERIVIAAVHAPNRGLDAGRSQRVTRAVSLQRLVPGHLRGSLYE